MLHSAPFWDYLLEKGAKLKRACVCTTMELLGRRSIGIGGVMVTFGDGLFGFSVGDGIGAPSYRPWDTTTGVGELYKHNDRYEYF